jgi:hypothetical protein
VKRGSEAEKYLKGRAKIMKWLCEIRIMLKEA